MPAVTHVVFYDDKAWPEHVEASEVVRVTVTWASVDGSGQGRRDTELYLTAPNRESLLADVGKWSGLGHKPGQQAGLPKPSKGMRAGPLTSPGSTERREWRLRLRGWSDKLGLVNREDPAFPAWQTATGKHYYPVNLENGFTAHEAGDEERAMALVALFQPAEAKAKVKAV